MTTDDRNDLPDDLPEDAPETESERLQARAFGKLIDGLVAGEMPPAAMEADQRELLDVASTVRASLGEVELESSRRDAVINAAFDAAFAGVLGTRATSTTSASDVASNVRSLEGARRSKLRYLPWATTLIAAAAAIALWVTRPAPAPVATTVTTTITRPELGDQHLSRPADLLIGKIERADAAGARSRIDIIVADRMAGYRDLRLRGLDRSRSATQGGVR